MATSLNAQRYEDDDFELEDSEIFVGNLPYSEDLTYDDYRQKRGLFSKACTTSGRRPWKLEKKYLEKLEICLNYAITREHTSEYFHTVDVHKIVNPLTYENPNDVTESYHFRPYAFVKCSKFICDKLLEAGEDGIYFDDSKLRLAISKGILSDHLKKINDEIISNSKKNKSVSLHPLATASCYLEDIHWHSINELVNIPDGPEVRYFDKQEEFDSKIVDAQSKYIINDLFQIS